ncbi:MAG: hypothetical protein RL081_1803 [Pseudomonadota bacterium]
MPGKARHTDDAHGQHACQNEPTQWSFLGRSLFYAPSGVHAVYPECSQERKHKSTQRQTIFAQELQVFVVCVVVDFQYGVVTLEPRNMNFPCACTHASKRVFHRHAQRGTPHLRPNGEGALCVF